MYAMVYPKHLQKVLSADGKIVLLVSFRFEGRVPRGPTPAFARIR